MAFLLHQHCAPTPNPSSVIFTSLYSRSIFAYSVAKLVLVAKNFDNVNIKKQSFTGPDREDVIGWGQIRGSGDGSPPVGSSCESPAGFGSLRPQKLEHFSRTQRET